MTYGLDYFLDMRNPLKTRISKANIATHVRNWEIRDFVAFLNEEKLKPFHLLWQKGKFLTLDEVEALRIETLDDLLPLIDMETWEKESLPTRFEKFLDKVNEIKLRCVWDLIRSVDRRWLSRNASLECDFEQKFRDERVVRVGGFRWRIGTSLGHDGSARSRLYHFIVRLLEKGMLSRFRKCQNCGKIFVKDPRWKCCTQKCKRAYDKLNGVERAQRREAWRQEWGRKVRDQEAFKCFCEFMKLAKKKNHTNEELAKIKPTLKALGGWVVVTGWLKGRASLKELYESLTEYQKKPFGGS